MGQGSGSYGPREKLQPREVSDAEYQLAMQDRNNTNMIKGFCAKYRKQLSEEEGWQTGQIALWRTLRYHRNDMGKKFTSSLHQFLYWEFNRACKKESSFRREGIGTELLEEMVCDQIDQADSETRVDRSFFEDLARFLPQRQREILLAYLDCGSLREVRQRVANGQTAHDDLQKAIKRLQQLVA